MQTRVWAPKLQRNAACTKCKSKRAPTLRFLIFNVFPVQIYTFATSFCKLLSSPSVIKTISSCVWTQGKVEIPLLQLARVDFWNHKEIRPGRRKATSSTTLHWNRWFIYSFIRFAFDPFEVMEFALKISNFHQLPFICSSSPLHRLFAASGLSLVLPWLPSVEPFVPFDLHSA